MWPPTIAAERTHHCASTMSKPKVVASTIRLVIKAGLAKPAPPVGPALGQAGLKIMDFCKDFNAKTAGIKVGRALVGRALPART